MCPRALRQRTSSLSWLHFVLLVVATALWFFPLTIGNKLVPRAAKNAEGVERTGVPFERIEGLAFCLLGLWILAEAVPNGFYWILMAYHAYRPESLLDLGPREYSRMAVTGTKLVIAIWLLLGAKGLRGLLRWARTAGT